MNKIKRSAQGALCGMMAALCMLLMFMTGLIPFATYAIPALAGILMIVIVVETNAKWALLVYIAVSLLSIFITPDREAAMMFIAFFGHYPILKLYLERVRPRALEFFLKVLCFNICIVAAYLVIIFVFDMPDILTEMGSFGKYSAAVLLGFGNLVFLIYDFATTRLIGAYINWFRPKVLRRFK